MSYDTNNSPIFVLVTTFNRNELLKSRSLVSISNQTIDFEGIIMVDNSDSEKIRKMNREVFLEIFPEGVYQINHGHPSAAGTWNQGLQWINEQHPESWVAVIDDDDEWLPNHIEICKFHSTGKDAVISGIRTLLDGEGIEDRIPREILKKDFYSNNPGWQGSNTFARVSKLLEAGGFDEDLLCTHDRDLALRCFQLPEFNFALTGEVTVLYHLEKLRESLTMTKGRGKHTGLLQFYKKHSESMDADDKLNFIQRSVNIFGIDAKLFTITNTINDYPGFPRIPEPGGSRISKNIKKLLYTAKMKWWRLRTKRVITRLLGTQFTRTREKIEIDITYACNLRCHDCNRSCRQAPENSELSLEKIINFIDNSLKREIEWKKIRILGGEPTLHSQFEDIIYQFSRYKYVYPKCRLEIVSNGHGRHVKRKLLQIPPFFHIENTMKESDVQPSFYSFNLAPKDNPSHRNTDFTNGCSNIEDCGIGLTPTGYYPCAVAGGIDRVAGWNLGRAEIPEEDDDMYDLLEKFCSQCGRFDSRTFTPPEFNLPHIPGLTSQSWEEIYESWRLNNR